MEAHKLNADDVKCLIDKIYERKPKILPTLKINDIDVKIETKQGKSDRSLLVKNLTKINNDIAVDQNEGSNPSKKNTKKPSEKSNKYQIKDKIEQNKDVTNFV